MNKRPNPFQAQHPIPQQPQQQQYNGDVNAWWASAAGQAYWQQQQQQQQQAAAHPQTGVVAAPPQPAQPNAYPNYGYGGAAAAQQQQWGQQAWLQQQQQQQQQQQPGAVPHLQAQPLIYAAPQAAVLPIIPTPATPQAIPSFYPGALPVMQQQQQQQPLVHTPPHHLGGGGPPAKRARFEHGPGPAHGMNMNANMNMGMQHALPAQPQPIPGASFGPSFPQGPQQQRGARGGGGGSGGGGPRGRGGGRGGPGGGGRDNGPPRLGMGDRNQQRRDGGGGGGGGGSRGGGSQGGRGAPRGPRRFDERDGRNRRGGDDRRGGGGGGGGGGRDDRHNDGGSYRRPLSQVLSQRDMASPSPVPEITPFSGIGGIGDNQSLTDFRIVRVEWDDVWSWGVKRVEGEANDEKEKEDEQGKVKVKINGPEEKVNGDAKDLAGSVEPGEEIETVEEKEENDQSQSQALPQPPASVPPAPGAPARDTSRLRLYFHAPISASQAHSRAHNQVRAGMRRKEREKEDSGDASGRAGKRMKEDLSMSTGSGGTSVPEGAEAEEVDRVMREVEKDMREQEKKRREAEGGADMPPPTDNTVSALVRSPSPSSQADEAAIDAIVQVSLSAVIEPENQSQAVSQYDESQNVEAYYADQSQSQSQSQNQNQGYELTMGESQMDSMEDSQAGDESQSQSQSIWGSQAFKSMDREEDESQTQTIGTMDHDMNTGDAEKTIDTILALPSFEQNAGSSPAHPMTFGSYQGPDPAPNRISISYAASSRRLVMDASAITKVRIFRSEGRIEIVLLLERREGGDAIEGEIKGVLLEAETPEHRFVHLLPSVASASDPTIPPLHTALHAPGEPPQSITLNVFIDKDRPLSEPKWVKTGDVNEHLGYEGKEEDTGVPSWKGKLEIVDPDKRPVQTIQSILEAWAVNSQAAQQKDRERFLAEHMTEPDHLFEILLRLVRGERASVAGSHHVSAPSGPLFQAASPGLAHAHQQTHVSLAVLALYRMVAEYAKKTGAEDKEARQRVGDIIKMLPSHLLYKSVDGMFRDWMQTAKQKPHGRT